MDSLLLQNIEVWTRIGVGEDERKNLQLLLVSVELQLSIAAIATSDNVQLGIDYAEVVETIMKIAKTERKTVERFAEDISSTIRERFAVSTVRVTIEKLPKLPLEAIRLRIERP
jgi:dihydroneopterin aldolase